MYCEVSRQHAHSLLCPCCSQCILQILGYNYVETVTGLNVGNMDCFYVPQTCIVSRNFRAELREL